MSDPWIVSQHHQPLGITSVAANRPQQCLGRGQIERGAVGDHRIARPFLLHQLDRFASPCGGGTEDQVGDGVDVSEPAGHPAAHRDAPVH